MLRKASSAISVRELLSVRNLNQNKSDSNLSANSAKSLLKKLSSHKYLQAKLLKKVSSIKSHFCKEKEPLKDEKENKEHVTLNLNMDISKIDFNNASDVEKIYEKVDSIKLTISKYLQQMESRCPKLEDLEASCMNLHERTKDLQVMSQNTRKLYENKNFVKFKILILAFLTFLFTLSSIYITNRK